MNEHVAHLIAFAVSAVIVTVCVVLHYEALRFLSRTVGVHVHKRIGVLVVMLGLLVAHVVEIIIFALGYRIMQLDAGLGYIAGLNENNFFDFIYFSSVVFTTVGFGDLVPTGAIRVLSATEGLVGLAMITWSASFTFLAMQRLWPHLLSQAERNAKD